MKTARQWFLDTLPKEDAEKAIKNTPEDFIDTELPTFGHALVDAFIWDDTEEGDDFWENILEKYNYQVQE